jgi:hypothetical protein
VNCPEEIPGAFINKNYVPSIYLSMSRQPFLFDLGAFQFLVLLHSLWDSLDEESAHHKAATYTQNNKHKIKAHRYPCLECDSNPRSQR